MTVHYTYQNPNGQRIVKHVIIPTIVLRVTDWSQTVPIPFTNAIHANTARMISCELTCTKNAGGVIALQALQFVKTVPKARSDFGTEYTANGTARINRPIGFTESSSSNNYTPSCTDIAFVPTAQFRVFYGANAIQYDTSEDMAAYPLPAAHFSDTQSYTMELQYTDKEEVSVSQVTLSFAFASNTETTGTPSSTSSNSPLYTVTLPLALHTSTRFTIAFSSPADLLLQPHQTSPLTQIQVTSSETIRAKLLYVPLQERNALTPSLPVTFYNDGFEKGNPQQLLLFQSTATLTPKPQLVFPHTVFANDLQAVVSMIHAPQYAGVTKAKPSANMMMTQSYKRSKGFPSTQGWYCCGAVSPSTIASSQTVSKKTELLTLVVTYGSSGGSGGGDRIVFTISQDGRAFLKLNKVNVATATLDNHRAGMGVSWMLHVFQETCYITLNANRNNGTGKLNVVGQPPSTFTLKNTQMLSKLYHHKHVTIAKIRNPKGAYPSIRCITTQVASNTTLYGMFYTSIQSPPVPEVPYLWQTWDRQALQAKVVVKFMPSQPLPSTGSMTLQKLVLPIENLAYEQGCNALFYISDEVMQKVLANKTPAQLFNQQYQSNGNTVLYRELFHTDVFMLAMVPVYLSSGNMSNTDGTIHFNLALFVVQGDNSSGSTTTRTGSQNSRTWCSPKYFASENSILNNSDLNTGTMFLFSLVGSTGRLCQMYVHYGQAPTTKNTQAFRVPQTYVSNCNKQNIPLVRTITIDPELILACVATDRVTCSDCNPYNATAKSADGCGQCVSLPTGNSCNGLTSFGMHFNKEILWTMPYVNMQCEGKSIQTTLSQCMGKLFDPVSQNVNAVSFVPDDTTGSGDNVGTCYECKGDTPIFKTKQNAFTYTTLNVSGFGMNSVLF